MSTWSLVDKYKLRMCLACPLPQEAALSASQAGNGRETRAKTPGFSTFSVPLEDQVFPIWGRLLISKNLYQE